MRNLVKQSWLSVASGLMYGLAWEPFGFWPLALVGWAGWMWGLPIRDAGRDRTAVFLHSLLFVLTAWIVGFHWVMMHPVAVAAMTSGVALLAYATLFAALTSWGTTAFRPGSTAVLPAAILTTLTFELALQYGPFAMPWLSIGWSTAPSSWSLSMGSWLGSQGTGLVLLAMAALIVLACLHWPSRRWKAGLTSGCALILLIVPAVLSTDIESSASDGWHVRLLEPGLSPEEWSAVDDVARVDTFASLLSMDGHPDPDITILPETALPLGPVDSLRSWIARLSGIAGSPVLSGGIESMRPESPERAFNVVIASGDDDQSYAKRRLVPFAEHVPFSEWIPGFNRFAVPSGGVAGYEKGSVAAAIQVGGQSVVPLICFESLFDRDARAALLREGSVLVVTTQDGWWGSNIPRRQHLAFSRMLAASTGHPLVHATVDGASGLVDAGGRLLPMRQNHARLYSGVLSMDTRDTLFMKVGNRPFFAIFAALAIFLGLQVRNAKATSPTVRHHS